MRRAHLCQGKDCRRRDKDIEALSAVLEAAGVRWEPVRCQKICHGPVLGLVVDERLEWFEKVRGRDARKAVRRFLKTGKRKALWKHRAKKRAGKLR